jgi:hypothetical protein
MLPDSENALKLICALVIALTGALWFMSFRFRQLKRVENANQNQRVKNLKNNMSYGVKSGGDTYLPPCADQRLAALPG